MEEAFDSGSVTGTYEGGEIEEGVGGEGGEEVEGVGSEMGELGGWRRVSNPPAGGSTMREISRAAKDNGGGGDGGQTRS